MEHPPVVTGRESQEERTRRDGARAMSWRAVRVVLFGLALVAGRDAFAQDCSDTADPDPMADCDGDGWSVSEEDCDDFDVALNPGEDEICGNSEDENCDGDVDEGCDDTLTRAQMEGGSSCASGGTWAALFFVPFPLLGWRRRR